MDLREALLDGNVMLAVGDGSNFPMGTVAFVETLGELLLELAIGLAAGVVLEEEAVDGHPIYLLHTHKPLLSTSLPLLPLPNSLTALLSPWGHGMVVGGQ